MKDFCTIEISHSERVARVTNGHPRRRLIAVQSVRFTPDPALRLEEVFGANADIDILTCDALLQLPGDYRYHQTLGGLLVERPPDSSCTLAKLLFDALRGDGVPDSIVGPMEAHVAMLLKYDNTSIGHLLGLHDPLERLLVRAQHNLRKARRFRPDNDNPGRERHAMPGESRNPLNPAISFHDEYRFRCCHGQRQEREPEES